MGRQAAQHQQQQIRPSFASRVKTVPFDEEHAALKSFKLCYTTKTLTGSASIQERAEALDKLREAGTFIERTHALVAFLTEFFSGWSGLTPEVMLELAPDHYTAAAVEIDRKALHAAGLTEFGFSPEMLEDLAEHSSEMFFARMPGIIRQLKAQKEEEDGARKNAPSSGGSTETPGDN